MTNQSYDASPSPPPLFHRFCGREPPSPHPPPPLLLIWGQTACTVVLKWQKDMPAKGPENVFAGPHISVVPLSEPPARHCLCSVARSPSTPCYPTLRTEFGVVLISLGDGQEYANTERFQGSP